ncbi:putative transposase of IS4/5 family DUF4096 [Streptomyces sp. Ag109_G2-6]|nr:putative transposase of IS4/5 family DUF4096 [Streptomyces sp. Ag109_G2-6]
MLTPGNVNDATAFGQVLDGIRVPRAGAGRPRTTPARVLGEAYPSRAIRRLLRRRGIAVTIPERRDQAANRRRRGRLGGRPPAFDKDVYRDRNVVERCFARLKQFRAIATRFDKLADRYRTGDVLASLILWLRDTTVAPGGGWAGSAVERSPSSDRWRVVAVANGRAMARSAREIRPWQTAYERFARWEADGTWAKLLEHVQVRDDAVGRVDWTVSVDSTINRAHQHADGARKKGTLARTNWKLRHARRRGRPSAGPGAG